MSDELGILIKTKLDTSDIPEQLKTLSNSLSKTDSGVLKIKAQLDPIESAKIINNQLKTLDIDKTALKITPVLDTSLIKKQDINITAKSDSIADVEKRIESSNEKINRQAQLVKQLKDTWIEYFQVTLQAQTATGDDVEKYKQKKDELQAQYKELVKTMKKDSIPHNEVGMEVADSNVIDKIEEPLTYDIEEKVDYIYEEDIKEEPKIEEQKKEPKFKNSEFISPIYGTDKNLDIKKDVVTSNKAFVMDDIIDEDFDEEDEFLDSLKDFRKNL